MSPQLVVAKMQQVETKIRLKRNSFMIPYEAVAGS
jgi:hypothetical protein